MSTPESPGRQHIERPDFAASPHETRLAELFTLNDQQIEQHQPAFETAVSTALALALKPHDQAAIRAAVPLARWQLFGKPGEALPEDFVMMRPSVGYNIGVTYNPALPLKAHCIGFGLDRLDSNGLGALAEEVRGQTHTVATEQALNEYLTSLPVCEFLMSFAAVPPEASEASDPLKRAQTYFAPHLKPWDARSPDIPCPTDPAFFNSDRTLFAMSAFEYVDEHFPSANSLQRYAQSELLDGFLKQIFKNPEAHENYSGLMEYVKRSAADCVFNDISDRRLKLSGFNGISCLQWLLAPPDDVTEGRNTGLCEENHEYVGESAYEIAQASGLYPAEEIGAVYRYDPSHHEPRIIMEQPRRADVSTRVRGDLTLRLEDFTSSDPYIPGYRLVGRSQKTFAFNQDETDPYGATVFVPEDDMIALSDLYHEMHLNELATVVAQPEYASAKGIASLIRDKYDYLKHMGINTESLLHMSLQKVFGEEAVSATRGYQLMPDTTPISSRRHVHSVLTYKGKTYIFSAPPTLQEAKYPNKQLLKLMGVDPEFP
jgi:hypothetical protein